MPIASTSKVPQPLTMNIARRVSPSYSLNRDWTVMETVKLFLVCYLWQWMYADNVDEPVELCGLLAYSRRYR